MISFLSSWIKNLALALIIVSILEMILPNNKTKKYVKMVMGLYILFSIISPFIENSDKFNFNNIDFDSYVEEMQTTSTTTEELDQTSMDNRLNQIYENELEKDIIQKIEEQGYIVESCKVTAQISKSENDTGIEKIVLKISGKIEEQNEENEEGKEESKNYNKAITDSSLENKIVTEIQKIQKVEINVSENSQNGEDNQNNDDRQNSENNEDTKSQEETNINKTDIKIIKEFLIKEYGVSEKCLKIS